MDVCLQENLCNGITYTHKYWGGSSSTGFDRGYGFQLRSAQITATRNGLNRQFEYSYKKVQKLGYFQQQNAFQCTKCDDGCATCHESGTCDISCPANCDICNPDQTCTKAKEGYFVNPVTEQPKKCDNGCATCSQSGSCTLSCIINCKVCKPDQTCIQAQDGFYVRNPDKSVQKCDNGCATCPYSGSCTLPCLSNCKICEPNQTCIESDDGFYVDPITKEVNNCNHEKCATCENSPSNCKIPCQQGCLRCNSQNKCQEPDDGYFIDTTRTFKKCDNRVCGTCETTVKNCIIPCDDGCGICDTAGQCITCKLGLFLKDSTCQSCNEKCKFCNPDKKNQCYSCSGLGLGRVSDVQENCGCMEGYYEDENSLDCQKCQIDNCRVCDSSLVCIECKNTELLPPLCQISSKGSFIIEKGVDKNTTIIGQCSVKCSTCTHQRTCDTCSNGQNRIQTLPCSCKKGYHDENESKKDCSPCPAYCLECMDSKICLECDSSMNRILNEFTFQCICRTGFKEHQGKCQKCYQYQNQCLYKCPLNTLVNEEKNTCLEISYENIDNISLIWVCTLLFVFIFLISQLFVVKLQRKRIIVPVQKKSLEKLQIPNQQ